jgi:hypothetical protein
MNEKQNDPDVSPSPDHDVSRSPARGTHCPRQFGLAALLICVAACALWLGLVRTFGLDHLLTPTAWAALILATCLITSPADP